MMENPKGAKCHFLSTAMFPLPTLCLIAHPPRRRAMGRGSKATTYEGGKVKWEPKGLSTNLLLKKKDNIRVTGYLRVF